jgi:hypothetical protein
MGEVNKSKHFSFVSCESLTCSLKREFLWTYFTHPMNNIVNKTVSVFHMKQMGTNEDSASQ